MNQIRRFAVWLSDNHIDEEYTITRHYPNVRGIGVFFIFLGFMLCLIWAGFDSVTIEIMFAYVIIGFCLVILGFFILTFSRRTVATEFVETEFIKTFDGSMMSNEQIIERESE